MRSWNIRLPVGEELPEKQYAMPDPDKHWDAYQEVYHAVWYQKDPTLEPYSEELKRVLQLASGYLDLTTYPLGQECCVGKLRGIWRALRARKKNE